MTYFVKKLEYEFMKKIFTGILVSLVILIGIILMRTYNLKEPVIQRYDHISFLESQNFFNHEEKLIQNLSKAIRFQTISYQEVEKRNTKEFENFITFLQNAFPLVFQNLKVIRINQYAILIQWTGKDTSKKPVVLMGHYDVVPAEESKWQYPPFQGKIVNNYLYGRGSLDDKITVIGILQSAEFLLSMGFQPQRTLFFSFGHDEEIGGIEGAKAIVEYLEKNQIFPEFVLDEGGAVTIGIVPQIQKPVATIGIAEKGYVSLKLIARGKGGHSSTPPENTAIEKLAEAIYILSKNPLPYRFTFVQEKMFEFIGPHLPFLQKMAFANLWLFKPIVISILKKSDSGRASIHTTMVPTIIKGGIKENIIPTEAEAILNFRILPGDSKDTIKKYVMDLIKDQDIEIQDLPFESEPTPISEIQEEEGIGFRKICETLKTINSDFVVAPYLVLGATDARFFTKITKNTYRFLPVYLTDEDMKTIHNHNERVSLDSLKLALKFYTILIYNL